LFSLFLGLFPLKITLLYNYSKEVKALRRIKLRKAIQMVYEVETALN